MTGEEGASENDALECSCGRWMMGPGGLIVGHN